MKRKIILSIALVMSVAMLSLIKSDSTVKAEPPQRFRFPTGFVNPGPGQMLRITLGCGGGNYCPTNVRILWTQYMPVGCNPAGVCRHTVESQGATPVIMLGNDAFSFDVPDNGNGVNVVVESDSRNVKVLGIVFDTSTQRVSDTMELEYVHF